MCTKNMVAIILLPEKKVFQLLTCNKSSSMHNPFVGVYTTWEKIADKDH
jgi:hypothetical protein